MVPSKLDVFLQSSRHLRLAGLGQFALLNSITLVEFREPVLVSIITMESLICFLLLDSKECGLESRESGSAVTSFTTEIASLPLIIWNYRFN